MSREDYSRSSYTRSNASRPAPKSSARSQSSGSYGYGAGNYSRRNAGNGGSRRNGDAYVNRALKPRKNPVVIGLIVIVALALLAAGVFIFIKTRPVEVNVNGQVMELKFNTSYQDLHDAGYLSAKCGDLVAVDKSVLVEEGGGIYKIYSDGVLLDESDYKKHVHDGELVTEDRGDDVMEAYEEHDEVTPFTTDIRSKRRDGDIYDASFGFWVCDGIDGHTITHTGKVSGLTVISDESNEMVPRTWMWIGDQRYTYEKQIMCLTYDDGPDPEDTLALLEVLNEFKCHATFFALGNNLNEYPDVAKQIVKQGSQLACHTQTHEYFHQSTSNDDEIKTEVVRGFEAIKNATGVETSCLRPPGGYFKQSDVSLLDGVISSCIGWDLDTNDYVKSRSVEQIVESCTKYAYPGAIILMHDGGGGDTRTVEATRAVLSALTAEGYTFVTIDELMEQVKIALVAEGEFPATILD